MQDPPKREKQPRWGRPFALAFLVIMVLCRLAIAYGNQRAHYLSEDGSYYYDLVMNQLEGRGFTTNISPFHQALPEFPYPSIVYPLWPLLAATSAKVFGLTFSLFYLPTLLYFVAVGLAFAVGHRYAPGPVADFYGLKVHGGHLLALILGCHIEFMSFTSRPYTEGLAYSLLLLGVLVAHSFFSRPRWGNALLLGLVSAAAFLTRSQNLLFVVGVGGTLLVLVVASPAKGLRYLKYGTAAAVTFSLCLLPLISWLGQPALHATLNDYIQFSSYSHRPGLLPPVETSPSENLGMAILWRFGGVAAAYWPPGRYSYVNGFGLFCFSVPLLGYALVARRKQLRTLLPSWAERTKLAESSVAPWVFAVCFSAGSMFALHMIHLESKGFEWYFASRHAIPATGGFALAWGAILHRRLGVGKWAKILLIFAAFWTLDDARLTTQDTFARKDDWPRLKIRPIIKWINENSSPDHRIIIVAQLPYAKTLRPFTPHAAYRGLDFKDGPTVAQTMFDELSSDFLLLLHDEEKFVGNARGFNEDATLTNVPGFRVITTSPEASLYARVRDEPAP